MCLKTKLDRRAVWLSVNMTCNRRKMQALSEETWELVRLLFAPEDQAEVGQLLISECGNNLPFYEDADEYKLEQVRYAVLKLSKGNLDQLYSAIDLAQVDWRDAMMAADFGRSVTAHKEWAQRVKTTARR